ncbi:hypothetical protein [Tsukamurella sp. USMM236]|uniref:hypothetical protein n=1 Tax=Tsukamurella sp. USMM236 TaxID=3081301 RepID=UPI0030191C29
MSAHHDAERYGYDVLQEVLALGVFEGVPFVRLDRVVEVGDTYLAARNTGPHLLTATRICNGYVLNAEGKYPFDTWECHPIELQL